MATPVQPRPARSFKTSVGIPDDKRAQIVQLLSARLADTIDLRTQAKHAHWNVKGIQFFQLHELFDQIASHLEEHSDLVAERITALGGLANGTARHVASNSSLPEHDLEAITGEQHVRALAKGLAALVAKVRAAIDTADSVKLTRICGLWRRICRRKCWNNFAGSQLGSYRAGSEARQKL